MLTGKIRNQVDAIWKAFWTGGISNPLEIIEQITYLFFLRRLDELQEVGELKVRLKKPRERRVFRKGKDAKGMSYEQYRWSRFKNAEARPMFELVSEHVFPWLRTLGGNGVCLWPAHEGRAVHHSYPAAKTRQMAMAVE
jgi:type I restriction enzyme M protein